MNDTTPTAFYTSCHTLPLHDALPISDAARDQMRALLLSVATASNPLDLTLSTAFQPEAFAQLHKVIDILGAQEQIHSLRSEEHTSELQSLMRTSYAVLCLIQKSQT